MGDTLVPLVFISDRMHLSTFAGDYKEWPVYMTIGNLSSKVCQWPSTHSVIMVAPLPIPIKNCNIPEGLSDDNFRRSKPVLAASLADYPGYSDLQDLKRHVCVWCDCLKNKLGDYVPPDKLHPRRVHNLY